MTRIAPTPWRALGLAILAATVTSANCRAQQADETLRAFAVHVARTPLPDWGAGGGIYLGDGLVLTAAHVVGSSWLTRPRVLIGTATYATRAVKEGQLERTDLTLLTMEGLLPQRLRLRHLSLCGADPWPGEEVVSVTPDTAVHTQIVAPGQLPQDVRQFSTAFANVAQTGNSGSGVFDARRRCLLGIVSRKISLTNGRADHGGAAPRDIAKYFVPASAITAFLPAGTDVKVAPDRPPVPPPLQ